MNEDYLLVNLNPTPTPIGESMNLLECVTRDGATLVEVTKTRVQFVCKCGTAHTKTAHTIRTTTGAFCASCTQKNTAIKRIQHRIALNNAMLNTP